MKVRTLQIGAGLAAVSGLLLAVLGRQRMKRITAPDGTPAVASLQSPVEAQHEIAPPQTSEDDPQTPRSASPQARLAVVRAALVPLAAALGVTGWTLAQARLLESRHPVAPLALYLVGLALMMPALAVWLREVPAYEAKPAATIGRGWLSWDGRLVLVLMLAAGFSHWQAGSAGGSMVWAVLLVPVVYSLGRTLDTPLTGVLAAAFAAVSGWPLALGQGDPLFLALAVTAGIGFSLLYAGVRLRSIWRVTGGALLCLLPLLAAADLSATSLARAASDGLSPALTLLDALSAALLLFNLTGDPNPLHGLVNRPVFAPPLAALFAFGLLVWAVRLRQSRRWSDVFPLAALVVALLPSALAVYNPDAQRAALALPVALCFAAYGAAVLVRQLMTRLGNAGAAVAIWLVLAALVVTALDVYV